jgi:hypothetical protein
MKLYACHKLLSNVRNCQFFFFRQHDFALIARASCHHLDASTMAPPSALLPALHWTDSLYMNLSEPWGASGLIVDLFLAFFLVRAMVSDGKMVRLGRVRIYVVWQQISWCVGARTARKSQVFDRDAHNCCMMHPCCSHAQSCWSRVASTVDVSTISW